LERKSNLIDNNNHQTFETVGHGIAVNILSFHYAIADGFNRWGSVINLDNFKKTEYFLFSPDSSENPPAFFGRLQRIAGPMPPEKPNVSAPSL